MPALSSKGVVVVVRHYGSVLPQVGAVVRRREFQNPHTDVATAVRQLFSEFEIRRVKVVCGPVESWLSGLGDLAQVPEDVRARRVWQSVQVPGYPVVVLYAGESRAGVQYVR